MKKITNQIGQLLESAEKQVSDLKQKLGSIDKATATANFKKLKSQVESLSQSEILKVKSQMDKKLSQLQVDLKKASAKMKSTVNTLKNQVKHLANKKRKKRRERR